MVRSFIFILCLTWAVTTFGSNIYRCEGEDGSTIFSQQPCAEDADRVDLDNGAGALSESSIESATSDADIRRVCQQALVQLDEFVADRVRELSAEGQTELAEVFREGAGNLDATRAEGVEQCQSEWSDASLRQGWQCMAAATTSSARQECLAAELTGQMFGAFGVD